MTRTEFEEYGEVKPIPKTVIFLVCIMFILVSFVVVYSIANSHGPIIKCDLCSEHIEGTCFVIDEEYNVCRHCIRRLISQAVKEKHKKH
jgi:hypothetical protein